MRRMFHRMLLYLLVCIHASVVCAGDCQDVVIVGTGSGSELLRDLAASFMAQYPDVCIAVPESIGSGGGIKAVGNDEYMLGRVARDLTQAEEEYGLTVVPIARIPIVFFVNTAIPLEDISSDQACGIYDGSIRQWSEVCEGTGRVRVIRREDGDSSLTILRRTIPCFGKLQLTARSKTTFSDFSTVEECAKQERAIAFGTWPNIAVNPSVRALALDGRSVSDLEYPVTGTLSLIYKQKNYSGGLKEFITFLSSKKAHQVIINAGGFPMISNNED